MAFDYRQLEPRVGIHPALRAIVGIFGVACVIGAVGLLSVLITEEGARDWSLLIGVSACVAFAWGCWLIAFGKLDDKEVTPLKSRSKQVRILISVACAFGVAQLAYEAYGSGFTIVKTIWAVVLSLLLVSLIVDNFRSNTTPGR